MKTVAHKSLKEVADTIAQLYIKELEDLHPEYYIEENTDGACISFATPIIFIHTKRPFLGKDDKKIVRAHAHIQMITNQIFNNIEDGFKDIFPVRITRNCLKYQTVKGEAHEKFDYLDLVLPSIVFTAVSQT